jgi:hypothetical protein
MAVDKQPAVGRILLVRGRSTDFFPWYLKGGKITRVAGQRAYFTTESGRESFTHEYSAIVDTEEEEEALLRFTDKYQAKLNDLHAEMTHISKTLVDSLNAGTSTKRVRRSK